jgi:hypothetical protein
VVNGSVVSHETLAVRRITNKFMTIEIRKAARTKAKLRVGLSGPSGSGKTYSALQLASGIASAWDKILLIDTENGSGDLYSNLGAYNVITLDAPFSPERYIEAIRAAEEAGMEVIVIDSVSHEWEGKGGCLEINDKLASAKFRGNGWAAWSETTPRHQKFIEAIVHSSAHVITTVRNKVETMQTDDKKVKKVGTKEIQREGFEYELTVNFNIDREGHNVMASKDRTGLFIARDPFVITEKTGEELKEWNDAGAEVKIDTGKLKSKVLFNLERLGFNIKGHSSPAGEAARVVVALTSQELTDDNLPAIVKELETYKNVETAQAVYAEKVGASDQKSEDPGAPHNGEGV